MTQETTLDPALAPRPAIPATAPALPLVFGTPDQFAEVRRLLQSVDYTVPGICARTGTEAPDEIMGVPDRAVNSALDLCMKLFLDGATVPVALVQEHLGDRAQALREVGLLLDDPARSGFCASPVALYPVQQLYIVSDHLFVVTGDVGKLSADVVYPALSSNTAEFIAALPVTPCERFLDIGAGTGAAALLAAAGWARQAWSLDITQRSAFVAEYNARLNGIENCGVLTGDLYEPVAGRTFDCIVSHPPYMPEAKAGFIFRDGGADGEQIVRRIITGLPQYLSPGGRFYCRCMATDRKGAPWEQRIRAWLGDSHEEFDVLVITNAVMTPANFYGRLFANGKITGAELEAQVQLYNSFEAEHVLISHVYLRRHLAQQKPLTLRRRLHEKRMSPNPLAYDWLIDWTHETARPEVLERLQQEHPIVSSEAIIRINHKMHNGQLRAENCAARTDAPFYFELEASPGTALLLGSCDGTRTVAELYHEMQRIGAVPAHATMDQFLDLISVLAGGGILELESHRLPQK